MLKNHLEYISNGSGKVSRVTYSDSSRSDLSSNKDRNSNYVFLDESSNQFNFSLFSLIDFALCNEILKLFSWSITVFLSLYVMHGYEFYHRGL